MQGKRLVLMGFDGRRWGINSRQGYPGTLGSWGGGGLGGKGGASPRQQQPPLTPSGCGAPGSGDEEFVSGLFSPTIWKSGGCGISLLSLSPRSSGSTSAQEGLWFSGLGLSGFLH